MQKSEEREVKFSIRTDAAPPDLTGLSHGLRVVERPEIRLRARYYDTAGLDLLHRGITLRHRQDLSGRGEDQWTLKLPDPPRDDLLVRTELSWAGPRDDVPEEALAALAAVLRQADLVEVAAFVTVRRPREVQDRTGRRLAEVDDDRVTVTAPTGKVFRQIEVELDGGDVALIATLTKLLRRAGATPSANAPKLAVALADRMPAASAPPAAADDSLTVGGLLASRLGESLDKLITHDIALRLEPQAGDIHQARVACRRLRSELKTFAPIVQPAWLAATTLELRWLGEALGAVRDIDVLDLRVASRCSGPDDPDADGFAELGVHLAARRAAAWEQLHEVLVSERYHRLLATLEAARLRPPLVAVGERAATGPGPSADDDAGAGLQMLVAGRWQQLRRTVRRLPRRPSDAQLHRVRIRAKQLRYAAESATPVCGAPAAALARAAERLQTDLGEQHDAVVGEAALRQLAAGVSLRAAFAAGRCAAAEHADAIAQRATWSDGWRALDRKRLRKWLSR